MTATSQATKRGYLKTTGCCARRFLATFGDAASLARVCGQHWSVMMLSTAYKLSRNQWAEDLIRPR
eukprot:1191133-Alexandrium_andersonii.AAC.1